jgi:hypothetical protein
MKRRILLLSALLLFAFCGLSNVAFADDSLVDKFIGNPLLILAALLVIVAVAYAYHKIRK